MIKEFSVLGLMSGTSLDGLDIAHVRFLLDWNANSSPKSLCDINSIQFDLLQFQSLPYSLAWKKALAQAPDLNGRELSLVNVNYGHYLGREIASFIKKHKIKADFASVHGHTIFHQTKESMSLQIGDGAAMAAESGIPIINQFRNTDIAPRGTGSSPSSSRG